jgi:hypothetical protein
MTKELIHKAALEFAERAFLPAALLATDGPRQRGSLAHRRALMAFADTCVMEYGFSVTATAAGIGRDHSTVSKNLKNLPDGPHIDLYGELASSCINNAISTL